MKLSEQAKKELKDILSKDLDQASFAEFTDEMLDDFGIRLLKMTAIILKINSRKYEINKKKI